MLTVPQSDPGASYAANRAALDAAMQGALTSGWYILGENVAEFEREFASWGCMSHALGVANGTDAITVALKALGIGEGHAVATVSHTAVATIVGIQLAGATPILLDIDAFYTLDAHQLDSARNVAEANGLRLGAILPVHLYGQPADLAAITRFAAQQDCVVIEDCAQAHGALWNERLVGSITEASSFSFYPTKNLGAFGDGGATGFRDADAMTRATQIRQYGWDSERRCQRFGMNTRLDELQAAVLRIKLKSLDQDIQRRRAIAATYQDGLRNLQLQLPVTRPDCVHAWHQFVIALDNRDRFRQAMSVAGIGTAIHYAPPNHTHPAYTNALRASNLKRTDDVCSRIVSLPMFPELTDFQVSRVIDGVRASCS